MFTLFCRMDISNTDSSTDAHKYIRKCIIDVVHRITVQTFLYSNLWVRKSGYVLQNAISSANRQYRDKVKSNYQSTTLETCGLD